MDERSQLISQIRALVPGVKLEHASLAALRDALEYARNAKSPRAERDDATGDKPLVDPAAHEKAMAALGPSRTRSDGEVARDAIVRRPMITPHGAREDVAEDELVDRNAYEKAMAGLSRLPEDGR
jgi:hypothetical protein